MLPYILLPYILLTCLSILFCLSFFVCLFVRLLYLLPSHVSTACLSCLPPFIYLFLLFRLLLALPGPFCYFIYRLCCLSTALPILSTTPIHSSIFFFFCCFILFCF